MRIARWTKCWVVMPFWAINNSEISLPIATKEKQVKVEGSQTVATAICMQGMDRVEGVCTTMTMTLTVFNL